MRLIDNSTSSGFTIEIQKIVQVLLDLDATGFTFGRLHVAIQLDTSSKALDMPFRIFEDSLTTLIPKGSLISDRELDPDILKVFPEAFIFESGVAIENIQLQFLELLFEKVGDFKRDGNFSIKNISVELIRDND